MHARIAIRFRPGVLDPEATAIQRSLHGLGFARVLEQMGAEVEQDAQRMHS